jgi:hypothetical protein
MTPTGESVGHGEGTRHHFRASGIDKGLIKAQGRRVNGLQNSYPFATEARVQQARRCWAAAADREHALAILAVGGTWQECLAWRDARAQAGLPARARRAHTCTLQATACGPRPERPAHAAISALRAQQAADWPAREAAWLRHRQAAEYQ